MVLGCVQWRCAQLLDPIRRLLAATVELATNLRGAETAGGIDEGYLLRVQYVLEYIEGAVVVIVPLATLGCLIAVVITLRSQEIPGRVRRVLGGSLVLLVVWWLGSVAVP